MNISLESIERKYDKQSILFCYLFKYSKLPKCIIGTNEFAENISTLINIDYFIDDFKNDDSFLKKPIVKLVSLPENTLILSCVVLAKPQQVNENYKSLNFFYCDYFAFKKYSHLPILDVIFNYNITFKNDFNENYSEYNYIFNLLSDKYSKNVFEKIIKFRLSSDIKYLQGFTYAPEKQYFEEFLFLKSENEVFADIGSFDGNTTLEFVKRCPDYEKIYVFEPDKLNIGLVKSTLSELERIIYYNFGLGDKEEELKFNSSGSSSTLSDNGESIINIKKMDDLQISDVTFIKIDIEGAESLAISGASSTIFNCYPIIAISVYHKFDDFWKIPKQILSIRDDYNLYLRHYTEGVTETVMYFVPKNRGL
jgi:FkbM family methyltransferase